MMFKNLNYGENKMTKSEYLMLKKQNKEKGLMIKELKKVSRNLDREFNLNKNLYRDMINARNNYQKTKQDFRINHIFLSLVRGRTREKIETNFLTKDLDYYLEKNLTKLSEQYGYAVNYNSKQQVISVTLLPVKELANVA